MELPQRIEISGNVSGPHDDMDGWNIYRKGEKMSGML
jgi:hypothetical protein